MTATPNTQEDEFENSLNNKDESLETHKRLEEEEDQNKPILTQPKVSQLQELPESDDEENTKRKNDCCFAAYVIDEYDIFFLCRCFAWCCVQIGECSENCCEGCAECINSCCNSQEIENGNNDCNDCDSCDCSCFD